MSTCWVVVVLAFAEIITCNALRDLDSTAAIGGSGCSDGLDYGVDVPDLSTKHTTCSFFSPTSAI